MISQHTSTVLSKALEVIYEVSKSIFGKDNIIYLYFSFYQYATCARVLTLNMCWNLLDYDHDCTCQIDAITNYN